MDRKQEELTQREQIDQNEIVESWVVICRKTFM